MFMFLINIPLSFCCCGENLVYLLRERTRKRCLLSIPPNILIHYDHFNPPGPSCELFKADITTQTRSHSILFSDAITPPLSPPRDAPLFPTHWLTFLLIRKHPPGPACCVTSPFSNSRQLSVSDHSVRSAAVCCVATERVSSWVLQSDWVSSHLPQQSATAQLLPEGSNLHPLRTKSTLSGERLHFLWYEDIISVLRNEHY